MNLSPEPSDLLQNSNMNNIEQKISCNGLDNEMCDGGNQCLLVVSDRMGRNRLILGQESQQPTNKMNSCGEISRQKQFNNKSLTRSLYLNIILSVSGVLVIFGLIWFKTVYSLHDQFESNISKAPTQTIQIREYSLSHQRILSSKMNINQLQQQHLSKVTKTLPDTSPITISNKQTKSQHQIEQLIQSKKQQKNKKTEPIIPLTIPPKQQQQPQQSEKLSSSSQQDISTEQQSQGDIDEEKDESQVDDAEEQQQQQTEQQVEQKQDREQNQDDEQEEVVESQETEKGDNQSEQNQADGENDDEDQDDQDEDQEDNQSDGDSTQSTESEPKDAKVKKAQIKTASSANNQKEATIKTNSKISSSTEEKLNSLPLSSTSIKDPQTVKQLPKDKNTVKQPQKDTSTVQVEPKKVITKVKEPKKVAKTTQGPQKDKDSDKEPQTIIQTVKQAQKDTKIVQEPLKNTETVKQSQKDKNTVKQTQKDTKIIKSSQQDTQTTKQPQKDSKKIQQPKTPTPPTNISPNPQQTKHQQLPKKQKKSKPSSILNDLFKIAPTIQLPPKQLLSKDSQLQQQKGEIQWPKQNQLYHIYSALNPRLVLDVAVAKDGYHDLILYDWKNQLNQMYYFKKVKDNYYHIINAKYKDYMKKSQKSIPISNVSKIKFSRGEDKLWQLIPAKPNVPNSFYIVSQDDMALDLNQGYAQLYADIIQFKFHKFTNQVWILRKNNSSSILAINLTSVVKFQQKASQLLYNVMNVRDSINECITLQEMKSQMNNKNIALPGWLSKPQHHKVNQFDLPLQTTQEHFQEEQSSKLITSEWEHQQEQVDYEDQLDEDEQLVSKPNFAPRYVAMECAKSYKVAYIWYGTNTMPEQYQYLLRKCQDNVVILTETQFQFYSLQWNKLSSQQYQIIPEQMPIRQRVNILKLLYLYFQSGIYSDFDTQINQKCFENIYANQIIFTNRVQQNIAVPLIFPIQQIIVPQQSFMMVRKKFHPQVKRMIQQEIKEHDNGGGDRWRECKYRQCLIVECQRHYRDNTYKKGYV